MVDSGVRRVNGPGMLTSMTVLVLCTVVCAVVCAELSK